MCGPWGGRDKHQADGEGRRRPVWRGWAFGASDRSAEGGLGPRASDPVHLVPAGGPPCPQWWPSVRATSADRRWPTGPSLKQSPVLQEKRSLPRLGEGREPRPSSGGQWPRALPCPYSPCALQGGTLPQDQVPGHTVGGTVERTEPCMWVPSRQRDEFGDRNHNFLLCLPSPGEGLGQSVP